MRDAWVIRTTAGTCSRRERLLFGPRRRVPRQNRHPMVKLNPHSIEDKPFTALLLIAMDRDILEAALLGLVAQLERLDGQIAQVRQQLGKRGAGRPKAEATATAPKKRRRRKMSAEARARIAQAQKKRWAAYRKEQK